MIHLLLNTVEIPAAQAMNWAPGRGSQNATAGQHANPNGPLNSWVPLDASYKQYNYAPGMDLKTAVPLDANALLQAAQQGATVNEAQGWVQNLNQVAIASQLNSYQARLKAYIDSSPSGSASTVGDVIGKKIVAQTLQTLLPEAAPLSLGSLALAAAQGGKIYAITQSVYRANQNILSSNLAAHSQSTQEKVQQALDAGYEVTIHESPLTVIGWSRGEYMAIDPTTGAGACIIELGVTEDFF